MLHKGGWVATLLGTILGVQDYKKVKFPCTVQLPTALKGLSTTDNQNSKVQSQHKIYSR